MNKPNPLDPSHPSNHDPRIGAPIGSLPQPLMFQQFSHLLGLGNVQPGVMNLPSYLAQPNHPFHWVPGGTPFPLYPGIHLQQYAAQLGMHFFGVNQNQSQSHASPNEGNQSRSSSDPKDDNQESCHRAKPSEGSDNVRPILKETSFDGSHHQLFSLVDQMEKDKPVDHKQNHLIDQSNGSNPIGIEEKDQTVASTNGKKMQSHTNGSNPMLQTYAPASLEHLALAKYQGCQKVVSSNTSSHTKESVDLEPDILIIEHDGTETDPNSKDTSSDQSGQNGENRKARDFQKTQVTTMVLNGNHHLPQLVKKSGQTGITLNSSEALEDSSGTHPVSIQGSVVGQERQKEQIFKPTDTNGVLPNPNSAKSISLSTDNTPTRTVQNLANVESNLETEDDELDYLMTNHQEDRMQFECDLIEPTIQALTGMDHSGSSTKNSTVDFTYLQEQPNKVSKMLAKNNKLDDPDQDTSSCFPSLSSFYGGPTSYISKTASSQNDDTSQQSAFQNIKLPLVEPKIQKIPAPTIASEIHSSWEDFSLIKTSFDFMGTSSGTPCSIVPMPPIPMGPELATDSSSVHASERKRTWEPIDSTNLVCTNCGIKGANRYERIKSDKHRQCNACANYYRRNGVRRPMSLWKKSEAENKTVTRKKSIDKKEMEPGVTYSKVKCSQCGETEMRQRQITTSWNCSKCNAYEYSCNKKRPEKLWKPDSFSCTLCGTFESVSWTVTSRGNLVCNDCEHKPTPKVRSPMKSFGGIGPFLPPNPRPSTDAFRVFKCFKCATVFKNNPENWEQPECTQCLFERKMNETKTKIKRKQS